jgi:hypothetical protein
VVSKPDKQEVKKETAFGAFFQNDQAFPSKLKPSPMIPLKQLFSCKGGIQKTLSGLNTKPVEQYEAMGSMQVEDID